MAEFMMAGLYAYSFYEGVKEQERASEFGMATSGLDMQAIKEQIAFLDVATDFKRGEFGRMQEGLDIAEDQLGVNKELLELSYRKDRLSRALATGDLKLAQAEATKAARIESAQVRTYHARSGASAYTRAYNQMTVNRFSTGEQKQRALEQEGLLAGKQYKGQRELQALQGRGITLQREGLKEGEAFFEKQQVYEEKQLGFAYQKAEAQKRYAGQQGETGIFGDIVGGVDKVLGLF